VLRIDTSAAEALPGVIAVITADRVSSIPSASPRITGPQGRRG